MWRRLDFNGNNIVSLAEIDKWVKETYPILDSKPAMMRAYKKTTLRDGDGDAWVERKEFPALLVNLFYFNRLFVAFDAIDTDDDRRVDLDEFVRGLKVVGLQMSKADAAQVFEEIDSNDGQYILFDEFAAWAAREACPVNDTVMNEFVGTNERARSGHGKKSPASEADEAAPEDHDADITVANPALDKLEAEIKAASQNPATLREMWRRLDFNGNNIVSLAEIDKWVKETYPILDSKPAMMRAYKKTTLRDGDGDAWVERKEFPALLVNLFYFNRLFVAFDAIDTDDDRRVDLDEFVRGLKVVGLQMSKADAAQVFEEIDSNDGQYILFDEFAAWAAREACPVNDTVMNEFVGTDERPIDD